MDGATLGFSGDVAAGMEVATALGAVAEFAVVLLDVALDERLEFLGDSLLNFAIAAEIFRLRPKAPEGDLSRLRASVVREETLATAARRLPLPDVIRLGTGELRSGGFRRDSTLADVFEALIGAVYLDSGPVPARQLVLRLFQAEIGNMVTSPEERNPKGELQECLQAIHPQAPVYRVIGESGPDHRRVFQSEVSWRDKVLATGKGKSKKEAEARAAAEALRARLWEK